MRPLLYWSSISRTAVFASSRNVCFDVRDHHVLDPDRDAGARRHLVAEVLQAIGEDDRRLVAGVPVGDVDQRAELLLLHDLVDFGERDLGRDDLVEEDAADRRVDEPGRHRPPPPARAP